MATAYSKLPNEDIRDLENCSGSEDSHEVPGLQNHGNARKSLALNWKSVIIAFSTLALCALSFRAGQVLERREISRWCSETATIYSPIKKDISMKQKLVRFDGALGMQSRFIGEPSPEIDAAWAELGGPSFFSLTAEDVLKIGGSLDAVQLPEEYGGGYMGTAEFSHQLHCLNMLRRSLFINYEYYRDEENLSQSTHKVRLHLEHCIESLRQNIMCTADPGVVTAHWVDGYLLPYSNFNTWKVCRSWEEVDDWANKHGAKSHIQNFDQIWINGSTVWPQPPFPAQFNTLPSWP